MNIKDIVEVTGLTISPRTVTLNLDENKTFTVSYTPLNATGNKAVTWTVSNSSVLAISGSTVTGLSAGTSNVFTIAYRFKKNNK